MPPRQPGDEVKLVGWRQPPSSPGAGESPTLAEDPGLWQQTEDLPPLRFMEGVPPRGMSAVQETPISAPRRTSIVPPPNYRLVKQFRWKKVTYRFIDVNCDDIVDFYGIQLKDRPITWYDINEFSRRNERCVRR